jgi:hypothetical protein
MGFPGTLWSRLARASGYDEDTFHKTLLMHLIDAYKISSDIVRETMAALNRAQS